jgi:tripartite-type tricarboxylate transporter receptor subunit TctC
VRRRAFIALLGGAAALPAFAQANYPERPIRLVIPFPPGGVNDAVGRPWAEKMKTQLGTIVVENQGGAGGALGAATVARAQPDGYTILLGGASSLVIGPLAVSRPLYDPRYDFAPIAIVAINALGLVVHPALPVRTLRELVDHAKANPGQLSYGSTGVGSITHLGAELFKSLTGTDIVHIPYRGAGPALTDLISGQIPLATVSVTGQVLELHRSGKLRLLAVTTPARLSGAPEIPSAAEAGYPGLIVKNFTGLFAPAGTSREIIGHISQATRVAMADAEYRRVLLASGFEPERESSPAATRRFLDEEIARWAPVIKAIGLNLD